MSNHTIKEFYQTLDKMEEIASDENQKKGRSSWECVLLSRQLGRPSASYYIQNMCDDFMELHGDRCFGDDKAMITGIGTIDGRPITFIGNRKGDNLKKNIDYNYG